MQALGANARPLLKAAATSATLMSLGDIGCQYLQQRNSPHKRWDAAPEVMSGAGASASMCEH